MKPHVLSDKLVTPDEKLVFSIIGDKSILWQKTLNHLHENYTDITEVWKYYNDGKSWLFRTLHKKKTIFWIRVLDDTFKIAFWFGDKAAPIIEQSDLPDTIKEEFKSAKRFNTSRSISIDMKNSQELKNVYTLIDLKFRIK